MIKKIKWLVLNFGIINSIMVSTNLSISTSINNNYNDYTMEKIKCRNKRQTTPIPVLDWNLGTINDNKKKTITDIINLVFRQEENRVAVSQITYNSAFVTIHDSYGYLTHRYNIHFQAINLTLWSIIRSIMNNRNISQNDVLDIKSVCSPRVTDVIAKILVLFNKISERNLLLKYFIKNDIKYWYLDIHRVILENKNEPQEKFTIRFSSENVNIKDFITSTDLGVIENASVKTIIERFYISNPWIRNISNSFPSFTNSLRCELVNLNLEKNSIQTATLSYNVYCQESYLKKITIEVKFRIKENDTVATAPFNEKKRRRPPDDDDKSSSSKRKSDSVLSIYDQPGTSGEKKRKPFTCDNSGTSSTHKATKNYNLGTIKNNQKDTIINTFIDNAHIKWKNKKTVAANFAFFAINPTYAKIKVTKPIDFVFKSQPITLKADEIINLSFNTADQITASSIIRILAAKSFPLPLFMWKNNYKNLNVDTIKNAIIDQIFSWLQYLKLEKLQLPEILYHLKTDDQILYDDENITITDIKWPENEFGEIITILKITDENKKIVLRFNEYDIRMFFYGNTIDYIKTEDVAANIVKVLKIYFKNLQLQIDQFVDHINKQARTVVNLGSIIDKSDIHILNALVQYAENHKIKNSSKMAKLIFKIWTKQPDTNPNIFITANNNNGKIVFPGNKIINIFFNTITKADSDKPNKLLKYKHQTLARIMLDNNNLITKIVKFANSLPAVDGLKFIGYTIWHASTNSRFDYN